MLTVRGNQLRSRVTRAVQGNRVIDNLARYQQSGQGNLLQQIWNAGKKFIGFIGAAIGWTKLNFSRIVGWIHNTWNALWSFNWNASDTELKRSIDDINTQMAGIWGGFLGSGAAWLTWITLGYGIKLLVPVIAKPLVSGVITTVAGEAAEDLASRLTQAITLTIGLYARQKAIEGYIWGRNAIKSLDAGILDRIFGQERGKWIREQWGNAGGPDMSFAAQKERNRDAMSPVNQRFWEEFDEEYSETFWEGAYIVAYEIDAIQAQMEIERARNDGPNRDVQIVLDRREIAPGNTPEAITFVNTPQRIIMEQTPALLAQRRFIQDRDLGRVIGSQPINIQVRTTNPRQLKIIFRAKEKPPYPPVNGKPVLQTEVTLYCLKTGLTWNTIKRAATPYDWGRFKASTIAIGPNGAGSEVQLTIEIWGASSTIATNKLQELLDLTTLEASAINVIEEVHRENSELIKQPTRVYPYMAEWTLKRPSANSTGRRGIEGRRWTEHRLEFALWTDDEPADFEPLDTIYNRSQE